MKNWGILAISAFAISITFTVHTASAVPIVEGFDLVSSSRTTRTSTDFVYRIRVRGDSSSYSGANILVTSNATATKIIDDTVNIGDFDAGRFLRPLDTFTIRQDRTTPFNRLSLQFAFSGEVTGVGAGPSPMQVGALEFLEPGGRPEHEASFPIQGSNPPAGAALGMAVDVYGNVASASYGFLNASGQNITLAALARSPAGDTTSPRFFALVTIPSEPFRVEINGMGSAGEKLTWRSSLYQPTPTGLKILPAKGLLAKNELVQVRLQVQSALGGRSYSLRLLLPPEFAGNSGPWVINAVAGKTIEVATTIKAPSAGEDYTFYTIVAEATPTDPALGILTSSLKVLVE